MQFTDFFIRRAITTTLIMVAILGFGLLSYFSLPVSNLPAVEYPTIQVSAALPGANPDVMASSVATPLEAESGRAAHPVYSRLIQDDDFVRARSIRGDNDGAAHFHD